MLFIYYKPVNFFLRIVLRPFVGLIPQKYHFAINGTLKVRINSQTNIRVILNPTSPMGKQLYWRGIKGMEYDSVKIFMEIAKKSKVFFDIGANIGYYSLVASAINKEIKVYGFDPMPDAIHYFNLNKDINRLANITIEALAVSNANSEMEFTVVRNPKFKSVKYHLKGDSSLGVHDKQDGTTEIIKVKTIRLDDYVSQHSIKNIDLIKIDAEASEHLVLEGGRNILKTHRPIIQCEVLHNKIETELENIFTENNYMFFEPTKTGLVRIPTLKNENRDKAEYYFIPLEKINEISSLESLL